MDLSFYYIFCSSIIIITIIHIYTHRKTFLCLSNIVLIIFNLIFTISPNIIPNNPIRFDIDLLSALMLGFFIMVFVFNIRTPPKKLVRVIDLQKIGHNRTLNFLLIVIGLRIIYLLITGEYTKALTTNRGLDRLENYYEESFDLVSIFRKIIADAFLVVAALCGLKGLGKKRVMLGFIMLAIEAFAVSQHRTPVITPLLLMFMYYHLYIKQLKPVTFVVIGIMVILFMSFAAYVRVGNIGLASGQTFQQQIAHGLRGLNTSESFSEMKTEIDKGRIEYEYGYQLWLELLTPVPRAIWPTKPNVSFSSRMTEEIYGRIGEGNWVRTFTVWGEGYAQFGLFGVILYSFILAYGLKKFIQYLSGFGGFELLMLNFLVTMPSLIRTDFFAVYTRAFMIVVILFVALALLGFKKYNTQLNFYKIILR